jgi:hypothetical protein
VTRGRRTEIRRRERINEMATADKVEVLVVAEMIHDKQSGYEGRIPQRLCWRDGRSEMELKEN